MSYIPTTPAEQRAMLRAIGVTSIEELLADVPAEVRLKRRLNIPPPMSEPDVKRLLTDLSRQNIDLDSAVSFLGAGNYQHLAPSLVSQLAGRSEFYTSYTQYQPELSQGMLQALYEYQTMVCEITGMDVANASLYDGATAVVEAALLAVGPAGRGEVLVSRALDPHYRATLATYARTRGFTVRELGLENGATALAELEAALSDETRDVKAVIVQHPNFLGALEDVRAIERLVHKTPALFVVAITEPASLGVLAAPGAYGADIVAAEGYSLGNPIGFGGPALGVFATKSAYLRRLPGRIVGKTIDTRGQTGYVLTLQTREQHIRRERATSNICTNQALLALVATIYLATLGKSGFRELGEQCLQRAHYAAERIQAIPGFALLSSRPFFDEFAVRTPIPVADLNARLLERGIFGGYDLARDYPELSQEGGQEGGQERGQEGGQERGHAALFAVTEARTREQIDRLVEALAEIAGAAIVGAEIAGEHHEH